MKVFITALILCYTICHVQAKAFTSYACKGRNLKLFCHPGEKIVVESANYGRTNATICQDNEDAVLDLNCYTRKAHKIVSRRCNGNTHCSVEATKYLFGDPCPGQIKYLEATYRCQTKDTSSGRNPAKPGDIPIELNDLYGSLNRQDLENELSNERGVPRK